MLKVKIAIALVLLALMILPVIMVVRSRMDRARRRPSDDRAEP
jgi:hypothetical protein